MLCNAVSNTAKKMQCMEKGLKNLNQAYRAAQKKQGTYDEDHGDSGISCSDLDEEHGRHEHEHRRMPSATLSDIPETAYQQYQPSSYHQPTHQRVPSIQNMLQHVAPPYPSLDS